MPSAFGISVIFLLISLLISLKNNFKEIISDKINLLYSFHPSTAFNNFNSI